MYMPEVRPASAREIQMYLIIIVYNVFTTNGMKTRPHYRFLIVIVIFPVTCFYTYFRIDVNILNVWSS